MTALRGPEATATLAAPPARRPIVPPSLDPPPGPAGVAAGASPAPDGAVGSTALLALLQLGDSLFPSGGFTLSHGLETLAEKRIVRTAADLRRWLATTIRWQVAPADGCAAGAAWLWADDPSVVREIDGTLLATKLAREPREASVRTGRQTLAILAELVGGRLADFRADVLAGLSPGTAPVVLGLAGRALGLGRRETVLLLLHQYAAGCLGASLRLLDVDDVEVQRARLALAPAIANAAEEALAIPWKEMYACAPQTELMTMLHERATMRLFAT